MSPREAGQGLLPTLFGFAVVLVIALFATQVVFDLYARSAVTSAAVEAARSVAGFAASDAYATGAPSAAEQQAMSTAESRARSALGRWGDLTSFSWRFLPPGAPPEVVELEVRFDATSSGFNLAGPLALPGLNRFARTVHVRVEHLTCPSSAPCRALPGVP